MKNLDRLLIVLAIFIVLACRCSSDSFGSRRTANYPTPNSTPKPLNNSPTPNLADLGEYRECSELGKLTYDVDPKATPVTLTVNNKSPIRLDVYGLGPNGKKSKSGGVSPGDTFSYKTTFRGEWYMVTDTSGKCLMIVSPPNTVNIK